MSEPPAASSRRTRIPLPAPAPGTERALTVLRFGAPGARPKAYLQAGLHADEPPGLLVLNHLATRLEEAERAGELRGEIVLVPLANPTGLAQHVHGRLLGRFDLDTGSNFNRHYPDLTEAVATDVQGALGADVASNVALIREAMRARLAALTVSTEVECLRLSLMRLAADADLALDLHCDFEAVLHVYLGTPLWPHAADLAAQMGSRATLLATVSGGNPFDEAIAGPWWLLAERFPGLPIPPACLAATIELRGERDVTEELAREDATNLYRFLQRRGVIGGDPGALPAALADATPLEGVDMVYAPKAGVVVYTRSPGAQLQAGDPVAVLVDPLEADYEAARTTVRAATSGLLFQRRSDRFVRPGQVLCKVAGARPLPGRAGGPLLTP